MVNYWRLPLFFLLSFFFLPHANCQDSLEARMNVEMGKAFQFFYTNYDSTIHYFDNTIDLAKKIDTKVGVMTFLFYKIKCASDFYKLKEQKQFLNKAETYFEKVKEQIDSVEQRDELALNLAVYYGNYYYKLGNFNKAIPYFQKINSTLKDKASLSWEEYEYLIKNLLYIGTIHKKQGNYQQALDNFLRANLYNNECIAKHKKSAAIGILPKHLAETYQFMGDSKNAELHYKKVIANNSKKKKTVQINSLNAIAKFYMEKNRFDSARYYLNQSLKIQADDSPFIAETNQLIGESYQTPANQKSARPYFEKALKTATTLYGTQHYKIAEINNAFGQSYEIENKLDKAQKHYNSALANLKVTEHSDQRSTTLYAPKVMLEVLANKMRTLFLKNNNEDLKNAYTTALQCMNIVDSLRLDYDSESSRQFLLNKSYPIFEQGIAICHKLYSTTKDNNYLEQAFRMAEKSKAVLLLDALKNSNAEAFAGIPEETLESGYQLRFKIKTLEKRLQKAKEKKKSAKQISKINVELFEAKQAYNEYVSGLEKAHPKYYQLKYDLQTVTIKEIQNDLLKQANTSLIEYFIGDQNIYRFNIGKSQVEFDQIMADFPIKQWVAGLRNGITGNTDATSIQFTTTAFQLYNKLLSNTNLSQSLIIVPDGVLGYVPFDALLTAPVEKNNARAFTEHPYLLKKHNISYCFSATLLKEMSGKTKDAQKAFLGFAPSFKSYSPLKTSQKVTQELSTNYKGDFWKDQEANKDRFIKEAGNYNILHISSHAVANDSLQDACYLVCAEANKDDDHLIYNSDLYQLDLNASLVVLGACETGSGKLQRGEGIMSLARGFSYAGASSLLTTLWSVDEATTAGLLQAFYEQLQKGNTTNDALYKAKNNYLLNAQNEKEAHPKYWASLIPIGHMQAVNSGGSINWLLIGGGILLSCLLLLYFRSGKGKTA